MGRLAAVLVLLLCVLAPAACAQPAHGPESSPPAAVVEERGTPAERPELSPRPAAARPAVGQTAPPQVEQHPYAQWPGSQQYAPWVLEFVADNPPVRAVLAIVALAGKPLLFVVLLVGLGAVFARVGCGALVAIRGGQGQLAPEREQLLRGRATLAGWILSLIVASETVGCHWVTSVIPVLTGLLGALVTGAVWLAVGGAIAYALSPHGRDLVLSLVGGLYIGSVRRRQVRESKLEEYALGPDAKGRLFAVDALFTTFELNRGGFLVKANHEVMREVLGWPSPAKAE